MHYYWMKKKWFLESLENYLVFSFILYTGRANVGLSKAISSLQLTSFVASYNSESYIYDSDAENTLILRAKPQLIEYFFDSSERINVQNTYLQEADCYDIYIPEKDYKIKSEITVAYPIVTNIYFRECQYSSIVYVAEAKPITVRELINRKNFVVNFGIFSDDNLEPINVPLSYIIDDFDITLANIPLNDVFIPYKYDSNFGGEANIGFLPLQELYATTTWDPGYNYSATFSSVAVPKFYVTAQINNKVGLSIFLNPVYLYNFSVEVDVATIGINMDVFLEPIIIEFEETGVEVAYNKISVDEINPSLVSFVEADLNLTYSQISVEDFTTNLISFTDFSLSLECPYYFSENISFATSVNMLQLITDKIESAPKNYDISIAGADLTRTRVFSDLTGMKVSDLTGLTFIQLALVNVS